MGFVAPGEKKVHLYVVGERKEKKTTEETIISVVRLLLLLLLLLLTSFNGVVLLPTFSFEVSIFYIVCHASFFKDNSI